MRAIRVFSVACLCFLTTIGVARADIAAFNAAVQRGDYAAASEAAAGAWATLDKSRDDIALIANEFSFATYRAGDYAGALTYAEFVVGLAGPVTPSAVEVAGAKVLARLNEFHLRKKTKSARNDLLEALQQRLLLGPADTIADHGIQTLVNADFESGRWKDAVASTNLGLQVSDGPGQMRAIQRHGLNLLGKVASYLDSRTTKAHIDIVAVQKSIAFDIDASQSDQAANAVAPLYWSATAWAEATRAHQESLGRLSRAELKELGPPTLRARHPLLNPSNVDSACYCRIDYGTLPEYPRSAEYAELIGYVILSMDVESSGKISNARVLGSAPGNIFDEAVMKAVPSMTASLRPESEGADCRLERKGHILRVQFSIRPS